MTHITVKSPIKPDEIIYQNFVYVVQRQEKGKVCFGTGLERKTLEEDTKGLVTKHARTHMRENFPAIGPGTYEITSFTSATSALMNKPTSKLGTVLGGRKAERRSMAMWDKSIPGPGAYNLPTTFPTVVKPANAPFNSCYKLRKEETKNVPGVGTYNLAPHKRRTAAFAHSFGGKKRLISSVKMKCSTFNFDTCERCKKFPQGDYWYLDRVEVEKIAKIKKLKHVEGIFLCRECYDIEKKESKIFNKAQIRHFKKIRDCSKVHFHDGCEAKLFLVPPQEIAKVKEREAYLSLYFN